MGPIIAAIVVVFLIAILSISIKVVNEYERGVIFRLGRLMGAKGPGFFMIIPFIDRMVKIDLRVITMDVPAQDVITRDNVTVRVPLDDAARRKVRAAVARAVLSASD